MLQGYLYVWGLQDWLDHVPDSHRSQCTMFSCTKKPISQCLGILMYYGMVKPLASMSFAQRELAYDHKTVPHTNPTTKLQFDKTKYWINCPLWICKRRISNPSAFRFLVGFEERLLECAMWKFASKNSWSHGLLKRAPTLPQHCGITHLMMAPPKSLKVLQGLPVMYRAESWVGRYNRHLPSHNKVPCIEAHLSPVLNAYVSLCTTMHNLIPTQCWTLEIFQFTCDSIIANLFSSPFHTTDCGNWSAYTSKQAGMHLANLRWCFLRA